MTTTETDTPVRELVLAIEDEPQVRRFLRASLTAHGYRFLEAETGEAGLTLAAQHLPSLVLLDLGLPDVNGLAVTKRLREWSEVPIIVLSARGQEGQKVEVLDAGADDYLTKPFGVQELLARMRVALRRSTRGRAELNESSFVAGPLRVNLAFRRVFVNDVEVHLTPIEYNILGVLVRHAGKVVTHRQLLELVWGPNAAEQTHYLRVHMAHIRRKLEPNPARPRLFATEAGVGYRLRTEADAP